MTDYSMYRNSDGTMNYSTCTPLYRCSDGQLRNPSELKAAGVAMDAAIEPQTQAERILKAVAFDASAMDSLSAEDLRMIRQAIGSVQRPTRPARRQAVAADQRPAVDPQEFYRQRFRSNSMSKPTRG
jgi:hypothetical protein